MTIVDLNVGGVHYTSTVETLTNVKDSLLHKHFSQQPYSLEKDSQGHYFLDRDGMLFRYILDFLRSKRLILPEDFKERERLKQEADYFHLAEMSKLVSHRFGPLPPLNIGSIEIKTADKETNISDKMGTITIGYRGTFAFGRDGMADVKFRKLSRLLVCGRVLLCRAVFGDSLNESRDPDRGEEDRYTSRFFLKHTYLEQAFDLLLKAGFTMAGSCGTGTNSIPAEGMQMVQTGKAGTTSTTIESEEGKWFHYNEFVWMRN